MGTTEDCGHFFDCDAAGNGYFPDPFNCRKYWHCYGGGTHEHILCPDDPQTAQTSPLLTVQNWLTVITQTSITAGSTGTALGAWVNMFCAQARNRMEEWKISSTMKKE